MLVNVSSSLLICFMSELCTKTFTGEDVTVGKIYDRHLGLAAQLAGIVRSEAEIRFQETSCTTPESIQRMIAAAEGDQYTVIKRYSGSKRKAMMIMGETPIGIACPDCGRPRLDINPWLVRTAGRPLIYVQPQVPCPNCKEQQFFVPVENIAFTHPNELSPYGGLFKTMGTFSEGARLSHPSGDDMVLQPGLHAPVWIPGSEVFVRAESTK